MNINVNETLSQSLSVLAYHWDGSKMPTNDRSNIFLGIGLWSKSDRLSKALPVDVMHMLLSAAVLRAQIALKRPSKIIILIADSMAIREGAHKEEVSKLVVLYKKSLEPFLKVLKISECSEVILSSDLELYSIYQETFKSVKKSPFVKQLKKEDTLHYLYIRTQTTITRYMNEYRDVWAKVGWACKKSIESLKDDTINSNAWDEIKFDHYYGAICPEFPMQYLYTKAGLKLVRSNRRIDVIEGCPYTSYPKDNRYDIQTEKNKEIKTICHLQPGIKSRWKEVANVCAKLIETNIAEAILLPKDCVQPNNVGRTVYNMLNHWANIHFPLQE